MSLKNTGVKAPVGVTVLGLDARVADGLRSLGLPDGSVSLPSLAFKADTDTGFFRQGANEIGVALGGVIMGRFSTFGLHIPGTTVAGLSRLFTLGAAAFGVTNARFEDGLQATIDMQATGAGGRRYSVLVNTSGQWGVRDETALSTRYTVESTGNFTMRGNFDLLPMTDNQGRVGTPTNRFSLVRAVTITSGAYLEEEIFPEERLGGPEIERALEGELLAPGLRNLAKIAMLAARLVLERSRSKRLLGLWRNC